MAASGRLFVLLPFYEARSDSIPEMCRWPLSHHISKLFIDRWLMFVRAFVVCVGWPLLDRWLVDWLFVCWLVGVCLFFFFFLMMRRPPRSALLPCTSLFRLGGRGLCGWGPGEGSWEEDTSERP